MHNLPLNIVEAFIENGQMIQRLMSNRVDLSSLTTVSTPEEIKAVSVWNVGVMTNSYMRETGEDDNLAALGEVIAELQMIRKRIRSSESN